MARYAGSHAGPRASGGGLDPHSDRDALEAALADCGEAITYLREVHGAQDAQAGTVLRLRFDQLRDVEGAVRILQVEGASLEGREILDLFHNFALAGEFRGALLGVVARFPRLARRAHKLADLRDLAKRYARTFLPDGSLADEASVALGRIRRDIDKQQKSIQDSLERFMRAHRSDGTLQEDFVTIREDRFVVPIVAGHKGTRGWRDSRFKRNGAYVVSGPRFETIGLNDQLVRLKEDELREIERIFAEITNALRVHAEDISATEEALAEIDLIFAKAGFARDYDAVIPKFSGAERRLI